MDPYYLLSVIALACALPLVWWLARRTGPPKRQEQQSERMDTLAAWPPEATRVLRSSERLAFSTLKLALPGYMILAQVPIARFLNVPKRNSYAEWMRRLGSQCVDFVVCDVTSQVIAVVEIRPPIEQIGEKLRARLDRVERVLTAANIPVHVWNEERLPTIEAAREKLLPRTPAVPSGTTKRPLVDLQPLTTGAAVVMAGAVLEDAPAGVVAPAIDPFADTDQDWNQGEVIEVREPTGSTWFDELEEAVSPVLPPQEQR
ncbi:MAG: DUF2726 domain-containing protein [Caldimonas sp.]